MRMATFAALMALMAYGCTVQQHEQAAAVGGKIATAAAVVETITKSPVADAVAVVVPAVKPFQVGIEYIAGGLAALAAAFAAWQNRKAVEAKRERNAAFDRMPTEKRKEAIEEARK